MRVGAVDIGTNTARLLIADVSSDGLTQIERHAEVVGLGSGLAATGAINPDALARTEIALSRYHEAIVSAGADAVGAVATSATRDASNRVEALDRMGEALGWPIELIDGSEEAGLAFSGATAGLTDDGIRLVIDPGGGSTEFVLGGLEPEGIHSIDMGSVRLTDSLLPDRPAPVEQIAIARNRVRHMFSVAAPRRTPDLVIGVAGTFTSLAAIWLELDRYDPDAVHGTVLTAPDLVGLVDRLAPLTIEQTAAIPSLDPKRAPVILAGAVIVREALEVSGSDRVTVSESDLLDGLAMRVSRA